MIKITTLLIIFISMLALASLVLVYLTKRKIEQKTTRKAVKKEVIPVKVIKKESIITSWFKARKLAKETSEPEVVEEKIKPFDAIRYNKSKLSLKYWKSHFKDKLFPEKTALINMELTNGMNRQFIAIIKADNTFKYRGKLYLVDNESKYYIIDSKIWAYDFHEDFTLPIRRRIPLTKIKKTLEHSNVSEVEYATNPSTLERFTISKIAEGIMRGQQIDEFFKRIQLLMIITMVAAVVHLVLFMAKSGMLSQIKIPGVTG